MENRGKRATKNHRKYTFLAVFVQFLVRCNGGFIRARGVILPFLMGASSRGQCKKPRVVRGSGHAHVAMSKLVLVILAAQKGLCK
jgi:hypothetical protein